MERGGAAIDSLLTAFAKAKQADVAAERLDAARRLQRKSQVAARFRRCGK
jgi:hypothetical protein